MLKRFFAGILTLASLGTFPALIYHAGGYDRGRVTGTLAQAAAGEARLDAAKRRRVLDLVIANVRRYYFDRDVAQKTSDVLLAHEFQAAAGTIQRGR
jgi:hypothetical protein